jgi:CRISPR-associated protein Cmr1
MHGADGSSAELRPASIKGVLRFWWRAIHGNLKTIKELHDEESKIFGSTEGRSSFTLRVIHKLSTAKPKINPLPHKNVFTVNGYQANQTFKVTISGKNLEPIKNLFILATTLGGFGQRSRRGFGSVKITKIDDTDFTPPTTEQEIKAKIADTFKYTSQIKYPYIKKIEIGHNPNNMDELLKKISQATHDIRELDKNLSKEEKVQKQLLDYTFGSANPRYASPIYVSILKFDDKDYRPVITTLKNTKPDNNNEKVTLFKGAING